MREGIRGDLIYSVREVWNLKIISLLITHYSSLFLIFIKNATKP